MRLRVWKTDNVIRFCCPGCESIRDINEDQLYGQISIACPDCDYYEAKDWREELTTFRWINLSQDDMTL